MSRVWFSSRSLSWRVTLLLTLALAACHDTPRNNPFDPSLTPAVELVSVAVEDTTGSADLKWTAYAGRQPFAGYRILRQVRGLTAVDTVEVIEDVHRTTFRDTTVAPYVEYVYWVTVVNRSGFEVESDEKLDVSYELPSVELRSADFSSETATAELTWSAYRGPGFEAYEVRRRTGELAEQTVEEITDIADTTDTDMLLDGNTEYVYRIHVRTSWEGVGVFSNERRGSFYSFLEERPLPISGAVRVQAVGLALDERDGLYVAMTRILTTTARVMWEGILVAFPGESTDSLYFEDVRPDRRSPILIAAGEGRVYVSLTAENDSTLVGALNEEGVVWQEWVDTDGAVPVGLHLEEDGDLLMVDAQGMLYRFSADGVLEGPGDERLQISLERETLPLKQVVAEPGAGLSGYDQFFCLASEGGLHHVLVRTWLGNIFGEGPSLDEGVGLENGETLNPVALAFDRGRSRLLVLEAQGRLQVFDARPKDVLHRYITKWGGFGSGEGDFLVPLPISVAMVVDSEGMIYVADGAGRIQVFAP